MKRKISSDAFAQYPACHVGPVEVIDNFFCGSASEALDMVRPPIQVDTLVPLNDLNPSVWDMGFRGEILYYPIFDYGTLPDNVLSDLSAKVLARLSAGKKVGLFCLGGHGRTGYVAAVILGQLGYKDPIQFLRSHYCENAVESSAQVEHIAHLLGNPILAKKHRPHRSTGRFAEQYLYDYGFNRFGD